MTATFRIGQTVRWSPELTEWYDDTSDTSAAQVGRIVTVDLTSGSCCLCAGHPWNCPGPWYLVDFAGREGLTGVYAEHQLQAA